MDWYRLYVDTRFEEADKRYQQRDNLNDRALTAALAASEKANDKALAAAREAVLAASVAAEKSVAAALAATDKAVEKAEKQQLLHNAQQNEWRSTIADVTKIVAENARRESEERTHALAIRMEEGNKALSAELHAAVGRLDKADGRNTVLAVLAAALVALITGVGVSLIVGHTQAAAVVGVPLQAKP
jgi:hypothetical protein